MAAGLLTLFLFLAPAEPLGRSTSRARRRCLHISRGNMYTISSTTRSRSQGTDVEDGGPVLNGWLHEAMASADLPVCHARSVRANGTPLPSPPSRIEQPGRLRYVPAVVRPPPRTEYNPIDGSLVQTTQHLGETTMDSLEYDAGFEAAIQHLQRLVYRGRGLRNRVSQPLFGIVGEDVNLPYEPDVSNLVGVENFGTAASGHPTVVFPVRQSHRRSPPVATLIPRSDEAWEGEPINPAVVQASVSDFS
ncbi:hypothetical protein M758_UG297200 [Ceratodon purpureus]|nr:hypothetical protein M758_UG297200 [Ceratodon purpureus]